jgi:hypothetical protein
MKERAMDREAHFMARAAEAVLPGHAIDYDHERASRARDLHPRLAEQE